MKFHGKYILLVFSLLMGICQTTKSQISTGRVSNVTLDEMMRGGGLIGPDRYVDVKGDPFIDEAFQLGEVIHLDSSITRDVPMRLNHHTDEIEFQRDDQTLVFSMPRKIDHVTFGHRSFAYYDFFQSNKISAGYFEILAWGNCKLLLRRNTIVKREELPPSDMSGGNFKDYFRTSEEYFLKKGDSQAIQIQRSKKSLLKALGDHKDELTKFIEENKLKVRSEEEMIDLVYFYNSINRNQ